MPEARLPDGALVRSARSDDDIAAASALVADRGSGDDAVDLELVAAEPGGMARVSVVERDGRIVSTATLLDESVRVGAATLPAGQVELVATARDSEGRGYVRALMHRCHEQSAAAGHVLQVMIGIPHFYRQFGYDYSVPMHPWAAASPPADPPAGTSVRVAGPTDAADLAALQATTQRRFDVAMPHSPACWQWLLQHPASTQWIVESADGTTVGSARAVVDGHESVDMAEVTASVPAASRALVNHAWQQVGADGTVRISVRPHVPGLADVAHDPERRDWFYVRIPDPVALLQAMAPELRSRLERADRSDGSAVLSLYRTHLRLAWHDGDFSVTPGGAMQAPVSQGFSGLPHESLGALLLGDGAAGLEARFPDANLGRQADLLSALFPAQTADLLTFYLPT